MNIPILCLFFSALLLILTKVPVGVAMYLIKGKYDNQNPRDQQSQLTGWGKRALAAHQNHFEAFPVFAAGVLLTQSLNIHSSRTDHYCLTFIACRILFTIFYCINWDKLRTLTWFGAYVSSLLLIASGF